VNENAPLIPVQPKAGSGLPPVPVDLPLGELGREQFLAASDIQRAIDLERFRSYSRVSRILHFLSAALLLLYDLVGPKERLVYEFSGVAEVFRTPEAYPALAPWLAPERLLPGFVVLQTVLFHYLLPEKVFSARTKLAAESWLDLLWITAAVALTGGDRSPFVFLYFIAILNAAPTQTRTAAVVKAAASSGLLVAASVIADTGGERPLTAVIWPAAFLWIGSYLSGSFENIARSLNEQLLRETVRDDVTGLYTFRFFASLSDGRADRPYAIVLFDADRLKELNDTHGHEKGTDMIRHAAEAIRAAAREGDVCARLGGDEFIVRLKGATREGAVRYADRVRSLAGRLPVQVPDGEFPVRLSAGIACCPSDGKKMSETIRRADVALYAAKRAGRDRTMHWTADLETGSGSQYIERTKLSVPPNSRK